MGWKVTGVAPSAPHAWALVGGLKAVGLLSRPVGHKGLWHAAHYLGKLVGNDYVCTVDLDGASRFAFRCNDPYWSRLVVGSYAYEPEILDVRDRLRGKRYAFIDCGANFGLWSILFSEAGEATQVVAIEAAPDTLVHLRHNWQLNGQRFEIVDRAIFSEAGQTVRFAQSTTHHANAAIGEEGVEVQTTTIDAITAGCSANLDFLVVKLDVEGVEVPALAGARETLSRDTILIYEDHGNEPLSKVTDHVIRELGLQVFYREDDGRYVEIRSAADASSKKKKASVGYNFFAVTGAAGALFVE